MDFAYSKAEDLFREELRDWLADHLVGEFRRYLGVGGPTDDSHWEIRREWERLLAADRWLSISWPREYGGRGGTLNEEIISYLEFAEARAPYWVGVQGRDLFGPTLLHFGTDVQKARFLPPITRVEEFWSQGFSEPEAGSDIASLRTRAVLDGGEWVINGQKIWNTFGMFADWIYVLCRTDPGSQRHRGISMLMIDRHQPGVDVRPIRTLAGTHEFCEVFFTDARTPSDFVVGAVHGAWEVMMGTLGQERALTTLPMILGFRYEVEAAIDTARRRGSAGDPVVRQQLARAHTGMEIIRWTNYRMLTSLMRNGRLGPESSVAKLMWAGWHREMGELAMRLEGIQSDLVGVDYELTTTQLTALNARAETIYGGSNEVQRNIVGERALGLPK
ncbi:MAG: acyl-CoA dehydrogenase [Ilumatobacteraceae bacterium]|nr:acyl-CoA dehydrogenase [Ilumatobacteraceae bacterium]